MIRITELVASCLLMVLAMGLPVDALAQSTTQRSPNVAHLEIVDAWVEAPPQGASVAAVYMRIVSHNASGDRLLSITSPRAERVEMHEMTMAGAVMRMRNLPGGVVVPANGSFEFNQRDTHIMLNGINGSYAVGETIPLRLLFQDAGAVDVVIPVRATTGHAHH